MIFKQYYLGCLSHASYLVGDETSGRAAVVDPQRDVSQYLEDASAAGLKIEYVIETHFHADFVSGHLELAAVTGATICYGEPAEAAFEIETLRDGEEIELGEVVLRVLATPGHTPESISIVVYQRRDAPPYAVLTGDTLFIGDVGRPDLAASEGHSAEEMARQLYRSLQDKLLRLPDATLVYPAHGAGSACGRNLSTETVSTIGAERTGNYALKAPDEESFVAIVTEGQTVAPAYFAFDARRNHELHELLDEAVSPPALSLDEVVSAQARGAFVLDTRAPHEFASGHLVGSINVGLEGRFAEYAGDVLVPGRPIVLVSEPGTESEAKVRLARIGFDDVIGHLGDLVSSFLERPEHVAISSRVTALDLAGRRVETPSLVVLDVRNRGEVEASGPIPGAQPIPLAQLRDRLDELDRDQPTVVYCAGGYRSSIAASTLRSEGFSDVSDLIGGFAAWELEHQPIAPG